MHNGTDGSTKHVKPDLFSYRKHLGRTFHNCVLNINAFFGSRSNLNLQKICFFYLPDVPQFGNDFIYMKLGKKEPLRNFHGKNVVFEADLMYNLSDLNSTFLDYSGLYALYRNNLIESDHMLLIHYDAFIMHPKWLDILRWHVRNANIVFSDWAIDKEASEISRWVYGRIDDVFLTSYGNTFLSYLKAYSLSKLPNSSQFVCSKNQFEALMKFLMPLYDYIQKQDESDYKYAHLMERAWGLYWAMQGYKKVSVLKDQHANSLMYGEKTKHQYILKPLLTTAIAQSAHKFTEVL